MKDMELVPTNNKAQQLNQQLVPQQVSSDNFLSVESARAAQEVQAAVVVAKKFPRDPNEAFTRIMKACERKSLAEVAQYAYPRGSQVIVGPSIRLAEVLAQNWGNMSFGIRQLSTNAQESVMEAFCWDLETNVRRTQTFTVEHSRDTKQGKKKLEDSRDIYEMTANQGARRVRACILAVIPGDIVEAAVEQCERSLKSSGEPMEDRVRKMLLAFKDFGVTQEMIEKRLAHNLDAIIETELLTLQKIYRSLKDGMAKREDFFEIAGSDVGKAKDLNEKLKSSGVVNTPQKIEVKKDGAKEGDFESFDNDPRNVK